MLLGQQLYSEFRKREPTVNKKIVYALLMSFPLATACMDNQEQPPADNNRLTTFFQKRDPGETINLLGTITSALNNSEDPENIIPLIRRIKLNPIECWRWNFNNWTREAIDFSCLGKKYTDYAVMLSGSGGHFCYPLPCPPLIVAAFRNHGPVVLTILEQLKKFYPDTTLAQTRKKIIALFWCLRESNITLPRDVKKLMIGSCIATLLPFRPQAAKRLETILSIRAGDQCAYDFAKKYADGAYGEKCPLQLSYDPELLNPETAAQQYHQAYLDNCARFRKTIFQKKGAL